MNFIDFFDYQNKPLMKSFLMILTVVNAIVLAFLIFFAKQPESANAEALAAANTYEQEEYEIPDNLPDKGPLLELTDEKVRLKVGDEFDYRKYIETALDRNGKDMTYHVRLSGDLNMKKDGRYTVTYSLKSEIDGETATKDLKVRVKEQEE